MRKVQIETLSNILVLEGAIEFTHNNIHYEISECCDEDGYIIDLYSSNEKDENGCYLEENSIDGGHCTGSSRDAIEFML